jgi:hypothetical protein
MQDNPNPAITVHAQAFHSLLPGREPDSIVSTGSDSLSIPEPAVAVMPVQVSDTMVITPGPVQSESRNSVWDRIDSRDREIRNVRTETTVVRKAVREAVKTETEPASLHPYRDDGSFYPDTQPGSPFIREHIFPFALTGTKGKEEGLTVFVEGTVPAGVNSTTYLAYLETEVPATDNQEVHYSISWVPGMVIFTLLLLAWIKLAYVQFLTPVLISTFNYKEAQKLYISKNALSQNAFLILQLIFVVNSGLFLLFIARYFDFALPDANSLLLFLSASAIFVLLFAFKAAALRLTGFLFDSSKLFAEYNHNISLYNKILGVLLMPLIIGLLYADDTVHGTLIYSGLALGVILYFLQLVRGLELIIRKEISFFYLILYLCTFEIIPVFTLYKIFDTYFL